jgi:hypothetical protein
LIRAELTGEPAETDQIRPIFPQYAPEGGQRPLLDGQVAYSDVMRRLDSCGNQFLSIGLEQ